MKRKKEKYINLGDLELRIMGFIWEKIEPCSVADIHQKLYSDNKLAYTTIMTVMGNLYQKGVLERVKEGKAYLYKAKIKKDDIIFSLTNRISRSLFNNKIPDFFSSFLRTQKELNPEEINTLKKILEKYERDSEIK
ncbi:MAG: BlaI/MecI/CopY family transcriptional regulator [Armatimonadetes bacterium]|nr:BlaI/MecI/CopY family transcriptional regulator [Armatimonadota bacterium]